MSEQMGAKAAKPAKAPPTRKSPAAMTPKQAAATRTTAPAEPGPSVRAIRPDVPAGSTSPAPPARSARAADTADPLLPAPPAPAHRSGQAHHSDDHEPLRVAHLYPSLLNVAGDTGNLVAIQRRAQWRGIPVEVVPVEKGETPDFRKFDIVLFHGGQDVEMAVAAADFAHKAPSLREAAEEGVVVFAVCAGLQLLGHRYISNAGEEMLGAGILDLETRGGPERFMQHAACEVMIDGVAETIVGFENHSGLTQLGPGCEAFGRVIAGAGNNGRDGLEGRAVAECLCHLPARAVPPQEPAADRPSAPHRRGALGGSAFGQGPPGPALRRAGAPRPRRGAGQGHGQPR